MVDYRRIIRECFWDLNIKKHDIKAILAKDDFRNKKALFEKILLNSSELLLDLKMFKIDELKKLIEEFKVPNFNHDFIFRRKNIAEVYFLNKPLQIDELKWLP